MPGHNHAYKAFLAATSSPDPGTGKRITVERNPLVIGFTIAASASETNTCGAPAKAGLTLALFALSVGSGGSRVVTFASAINADGDTTLTFDALDEFAVLQSMPVGAGVHEWRVVAGRGATNIDDATFEDATITTATITTLVNAIQTQVAVTAEHGAGAIGTGVAPATYRRTENGVIITEIKVDLEGLASVATANDVIGLAAGGNAYIGQNVVASNGIIFKIALICLETPAGGDNDVNVVVNSSGTIAYDGAGGTTYGVNGGDAVAGQTIQNLVQGLTANHYFYLTAGTGDTAAAYTAGQFLIRLHGHPVLT